MTVHMIRVMAEKPDEYSIEEIRAAVHHWVDQHEEVLPDDAVSVSIETHLDDRPDHLRGEWRFSLNETKSELIDQIENALQKYVSWYIVGYHACYHDEGTTGCTWNRKETFGSVPDGVSI